MKNTISFSTLPDFDLLTPSSLNEVLELLNQYKEKSRLLAGGTDLLIELRQRLKAPEVLIDLKKVSDLQTIRITDDELIIGAVTPIIEILTLPVVKEEFNALYQALIDLADEIIRYRATLGGNIGTASPAADSAAPLYVLDAQIEISSLSDARTIPITQFFTGVKSNILSTDEVITSIRIPRPLKGTKSAFMKAKRSSEDLAIVGVACLHNEKRTSLAYTAIAPTPLLIDITDFKLEKREDLNQTIFERIWEKILPNLNPIDDVRSSKKYRIHMAEIITRKILKEALE